MTPDMIVRELANGFWFFFPLFLGSILLFVGVHRAWLYGRSPIYDGAIAFGLYLYSSIIMRAWVTGLGWQANHGFTTTLRDDYWAGIVSVALGATMGSYLLFRLTPTKTGHAPWVLVLLASLTLPPLIHFVPYLVGWSEWPPGWAVLARELRDLLP